ncbi:hypothetical protein SAMN02910447_02672 [Ruminococcus sp. YE71]|nr:hypothetical protein SAMN02910446_02658 [Ruminococcus sp. YE78]SFW44231.1 hypothetical protein SAMN02910447_02672 [Ruminococcus sp. YE71]
MEYTAEQRAALIISECRKCTGTDPYEIFLTVAKKDFVRMQAPSTTSLTAPAS